MGSQLQVTEHSHQTMIISYILLFLPLLTHGQINFPGGGQQTSARYCTPGNWGSWSSCSVTCGVGQQRRFRNLQRGCPREDSQDIRRCLPRQCPGNGGCGEWSQWSSCSATCGSGTQLRFHRCGRETRGCNLGGCNTNSNITTCTRRFVRKNVNSLSFTEMRRLQTAMRTALASSIPWQRYQDVAHYHGAPNTGNDALCGEGNVCCPHGSPQFLPWHRLLLANMEELLGEPLPYWDWTEDGDIPQIFESFSVPFKNTTSAAFDGFCRGTDRNRHRRGRNIQTNSEDLKAKVRVALEADNYDQFWQRIESPHNDLHVRVGCDMAFTETAAYDPIFYLHHANVDRQFAFWQELQRIRRERGGIRREVDVTDIRTPLQPFNRRNINPFDKTRRNNLGEDTLDYRNNLCYEYDTLTFDGQTPEQFLRSEFNIFNTEQFGGVAGGGARRDSRFFVGVILPKKGPSANVKFNVCSPQGGCKAGGSVSKFGFSPLSFSTRAVSKPVNLNNYYISEYEVTNLDIQDWQNAFARVTTSQGVSPVPPVIIQRRIGSSLEGGTVILAPGADKRLYGDMLNGFQWDVLI